MNTDQSSDELDLGQLFRMIGKGLNKIFRSFLRIFLYLKNNFWKLAALVLVGWVIGYFLKFIITDKLKTEVIVKPNFDSTDYLYDVVEEIGANIGVKDTAFFKELGMEVTELKSLQVNIEPIKEENEKAERDEFLEYLEVLQNFEENSFISDIVKTEILKKSGLSHKITFTYEDAFAGREATRRLMEYINENPYFTELKQVHIQNAKDNIKRNNDLIQQIDDVVKGYTSSLSRGNSIDQGTLVLENEKPLELPGLLGLKNSLIKEVERKRIALAEQTNTVSIIHFGKNQKAKVPIHKRTTLVIPILFVLLFLLTSFLMYLNRKSSEL